MAQMTADQSFQSRCTAPGVVKCLSFDNTTGISLMRGMTMTGLSQGEQVRLRLSGHSKLDFWRLSGGGELEQKKELSTLVIVLDGFSQTLGIWDL